MPSRLIADLQERIAYHLEQAQKYREALAAAQRDEKEKQKQQRESLVVVDGLQRRMTVSKVDFVYNLIDEHKKKGLSPAEVLQFAAAAKVNGGANFPYFILWKLKKEGSITARGGRYYPAEKK
jgi:hypothetical protein